MPYTMQSTSPIVEPDMKMDREPEFIVARLKETIEEFRVDMQDIIHGEMTSLQQRIPLRIDDLFNNQVELIKSSISRHLILRAAYDYIIGQISGQSCGIERDFFSLSLEQAATVGSFTIAPNHDTRLYELLSVDMAKKITTMMEIKTGHEDAIILDLIPAKLFKKLFLLERAMRDTRNDDLETMVELVKLVLRLTPFQDQIRCFDTWKGEGDFGGWARSEQSQIDRFTRSI